MVTSERKTNAQWLFFIAELLAVVNGPENILAIC
jgi:hypothetical protein